MSSRTFKKVAQQGRSERRPEAYSSPYVAGSERRENEAGGLFQRPAKLSVYVIAYNDEPNMRACLESVAWADELVVVDSDSTDATAAISREYTDKVYQHEFRGFGRLRNEAVARTSHDWVFSLDSDERMTPELRAEIRALLARGPDAPAYFVPRRNYFLGRWIRRCGWYPDYRQPQLFHRAKLRYREDVVHEGFDVEGRAAYLRHPVLQYPFRDLDHYLAKMDRYSDLMAQRMVQQGRRFRAHQLVTHPCVTFVKMYLGRAGFLDGMPGLILSGLYAYYTFIKYAKFWEVSRTLTPPLSRGPVAPPAATGDGRGQG